MQIGCVLGTVCAVIIECGTYVCSAFTTLHARFTWEEAGKQREEERILVVYNTTRLIDSPMFPQRAALNACNRRAQTFCFMILGSRD